MPAGNKSGGCNALLWMAALLLAGVLQLAGANPPADGLAPLLVPAGGVFADKVTVQIMAKAGQPHFTTDGSEPTAQSPIYSNPIELKSSARLKARVFLDGRAAGPVRAQTYVVTDRGLEGFASNLPLLVINTFGNTIDRRQTAPAAVCVMDTRSGRAALLGRADFDLAGEIHYRGKSSLRYLKRSYAFSARDGGNSHKVPLLGFPADNDWVLYAPYPDKTLMRDVLGYEMFNQMGHYAARTKFVEVFVNERGGRLTASHYMGVFVLEEKIKRAKDRVNIQKLGTNDNAEPNLTGGYLFKKDHPGQLEPTIPTFQGRPNFGGSSRFTFGLPSGPGGFPADPKGFLPVSGLRYSQGNGTMTMMAVSETPRNELGLILPSVSDWMPGFGKAETGDDYFVTGHFNQFFYVDPKQEEITPAQKQWLLNHLNEFERVLYGPDFKDPAKGYAAYIDVDSFIDHHLIVEVTKNIDGFRFSTFYSKDRGGKIKMEPIWDWNLSFGNANGKQGWLTDYWYWPQLDDQQYSWFRRLFADPDFGQRYVDRWGQLRTTVFAVANLHARIDALARQLDEAQQRNFKRWPILGREIWPNTYVGQTYADEVRWMKKWIATRLTWINRQFVAAPTLAAQGDHLALESSEGTIYYTLDGSDPRAAGGGVAARAKVYAAPIKFSAGDRLFARVRVENRWSPPIRQSR